MGPRTVGYPGAHWTSRELILKSCHRLLLFGFYWSENFESNKCCSPNSVVVEFVQEALVGDNVKGLTKIQDNNICLCLAFKILNKFISCYEKLAHECFHRKPCCTGVKILFSEKWDIICLQFGTNTCEEYRPVVCRRVPVPFFETLASTRSSGNLPVCRDQSKIILRKGDLLLAAFFRIKFGGSSGRSGCLSAV